MDRKNFGIFHATNPFGNEIETTTRWDTLTENLLESTIADMFSEILSDYIPSSEQNAEITAAAEQSGSSPASPDSTDPVDGAENATQSKTWPPLEVTDKKPLCEIDTTEEAASQDSNVTTPVAAPRTPSIHRNPSGSHTMINSADRNPFLIGSTQPGNTSNVSNKPKENQATQIEDNPLRYAFRTPASRNLNIYPENFERSSPTANSRASAETAPDSTITKIQKESQAARQDFQSSLAQLSQVHSRLARVNGEHVMRADVIMRDMDETRKGLLEIQAEGRQNQGRLETSTASLNDPMKQRENLADTRMAEMSAVMKEKDRQADKRYKLMSDLVQRRETDADTAC